MKGIKNIAKGIIPAVATYFVIVQLASFVMIKANINEIGLKNNDPYWKFVLRI